MRVMRIPKSRIVCGGDPMLNVERLRRLSKLAVHMEYGFPLSLRYRKGTKPPKRLWRKDD